MGSVRASELIEQLTSLINDVEVGDLDIYIVMACDHVKNGEHAYALTDVLDVELTMGDAKSKIIELWTTS